MHHRNGNPTHGLSKTRLFRVWKRMNERCNQPNNKNYPNYGGRGIKIEWKTVEEFNRDMGDGLEKHILEYGEKNTQIDRIDNDKGYSKENCRWVTVRENINNRRNTLSFEHKGKKMIIADWAKQMNMPTQTLKTRYFRGWPISKILKEYD
jgi:phenylpropionate dioxygenase-like ring-hydroxylating dioxygenase large terminal subunit